LHDHHPAGTTTGGIGIDNLIPFFNEDEDDEEKTEEPLMIFKDKKSPTKLSVTKNQASPEEDDLATTI